MILYGRKVAESIYQSLKTDNRPFLAVVLIGSDPASILYIKVKEKIAKRLGIGFHLYRLEDNISKEELEGLIARLNQDDKISGIIIQLPLPKKFDTEKILKKILPEKDIDGFQRFFPPPTAQAILEILKYYKIDYKGKNIVILGYGRLVGRPLEYLLKKQGLSATICDSSIPNLKEKTLRADILISATGVPGIIKEDMVSKKAVIIDAGTSESKGKIVGDVDSRVYVKVLAYTPVPGGVGPVTVACLMRNLFEAAGE